MPATPAPMTVTDFRELCCELVNQNPSGAKQAAEKAGVSGENGEKHTSGGLKPGADSIGFKPGINPRPTARKEFFRSL
jgi:hypothetical protein